MTFLTADLDRLIAVYERNFDARVTPDREGAMWSLSFHDPDGAWHEVIWVKPDVSLDDFKGPDEWEMIDPGSAPPGV